jgi:hypothetical protein
MQELEKILTRAATGHKNRRDEAGIELICIRAMR